MCVYAATAFLYNNALSSTVITAHNKTNDCFLISPSAHSPQSQTHTLRCCYYYNNSVPCAVLSAAICFSASLLHSKGFRSYCLLWPPVYSYRIRASSTLDE